MSLYDATVRALTILFWVLLAVFFVSAALASPWPGGSFGYEAHQ